MTADGPALIDAQTAAGESPGLPRLPTGICELCALSGSAKGPWRSDDAVRHEAGWEVPQYDPQFLFGYRKQELEALIAQASAARDCPNDTKQRVSDALKKSFAAWQSTFSNWRPAPGVFH